MKKLITIILIASVFGCYGQIDPAERHRILVESNKESSEYIIDMSVLCNAGLKNLGLRGGTGGDYTGDVTVGKPELLPSLLTFTKNTAFFSLYIENDSLKYGGDLPLSESAKTFMEYCDKYWYSKIDSLEDELQKSKEIKESPLVFTQVGSSFDKTKVSDLVKPYKESCSVHEEYTYLGVYSSLDSVRINNYRYKRLADGLYSIFSIDLKEGTGELPTLDGFVRWAYENGY